MSLLPPRVVEKLMLSITGLAPLEVQVWSPTLVRLTAKLRVWLAAQPVGAAEMSKLACQWLYTLTGAAWAWANQNWWSLNISASRYMAPVLTGAVTVTETTTPVPGGTRVPRSKLWLVNQSDWKREP